MTPALPRDAMALDTARKPALTGKRLTRPGETRAWRARVWTTSALRDLVYAGGVFVWSIVAFNLLVIGVSLTASLLVLIVGVFVWVGSRTSCAGRVGRPSGRRMAEPLGMSRVRPSEKR